MFLGTLNSELADFNGSWMIYRFILVRMVEDYGRQLKNVSCLGSYFRPNKKKNCSGRINPALHGCKLRI
ncbi:hypothetical protein CJ030_MR2G013153 [Morella rubra]|uniref:Uncharacterized protein n=1 Tax=Morella rubra TaxID=262757 RepID=A0A6A1W833_9ROSI|nr:hypothetical protein CJ030_MR2G013153 [Morella rubra]